MDGYLVWIAAGVTVSGLALLLQAFSSYGVYRGVKKLHEQIAPLIPQAQETLAQAQKTLSTSLVRIEELSHKANTALDSTNRQLAAFDAVRVEVTDRARVQMERLELVLDDSLNRVQEVVSTLHNGVLRPVREITGVAAGIKAAFQTFLRGNRPSVAQATHDDEMFI